MGNKFTILGIAFLSIILVSGFSFQSNDSLPELALSPAYGAVHLPGEQRVEIYANYTGAPPTPAQIQAGLFSASLAGGVCTVTSTPVAGVSYVVETFTSQNFPSDGSSYLILSTGTAAILVPSTAAGIFASSSNSNPDNQPFPVDVQDGFGNNANDVATLLVQCTIPATANVLSFDWTFGDEEEPTFTPDAFSDYFRTTGTFGNQVRLPDGNVVTANNLDNSPHGNPVTGASGAPLAPFPSPDDTALNVVLCTGTATTACTQPQTTYIGVTNQQTQLITLGFEVADDSDTIIDSAAYIDNLNIFTDAVSPVLTVPTNIAVNNDAGLGSAVVNYAAPTATDNVAVESLVQTAGLASGSAFPIGVTTNTFLATDFAGLTDEKSFTVTVTDVEDPVVTVPANVAVNTDPGQPTAVVNYAAVTASDNDNVASLVQTAGLASGAAFPIGVTTNTFLATDDSGNTDEKSFTVTVTDVEDPVVTVPANVAVNVDPPNSGTAVVNYAAVTASDNDNVASLVQTAGLASGAAFPIGVTTNTFLATDDSGNTDEKSFTVTVTDNIFPDLTVPADLTIELGADESPTNTGQGSATDNDPLYGGAVTFSDSVSTVTPVGIDPDGKLVRTITRTWSAIDPSLNESTGDQIIKVRDTTAPETNVHDDAHPGIPIATGSNIENDSTFFTTATSISIPFVAEDVGFGGSFGDNPQTGIGGVTSECRLNAGAWGSCTSPFTTSVLSDGLQTVDVRSTDALDNLESTATYTWNVDTTAPSITIDSVSYEQWSIAFTNLDPTTATGKTPVRTQDVTDGVDAGSEPSAGVRDFSADAQDDTGNEVSWTVNVDDDVAPDNGGFHQGSGIFSLSCSNNREGDSPAVANPAAAMITPVQQTSSVTATDIQYPIGAGKDSAITILTCDVVDNVGLTSQLIINLEVDDKQNPIIVAPQDTTPQDPTGKWTTLSIDVGIGPDDGDTWVADLVSAPADIVVTDNRDVVAPNVPAVCAEETNDTPPVTVPGTDTLPCVLGGTTTFGYTATDLGANSETDTQEVDINQPDSTTEYIFPDPSQTSFQIEDDVQITVGDWRSNADNNDRDTVNVVLTNPPGCSGAGCETIMVELTETDDATAVFTKRNNQGMAEFSVQATNDGADRINVSVCDNVRASHTGTAPNGDGVLPDNTHTSTAEVGVTLPGVACGGAVPDAGNPVAWSKENYAVGEGALILIEDPTGIIGATTTGARDLYFNFRITSETDTSGFQLRIDEQLPYDNDLFRTAAYITPINNQASSPAAKWIAVSLDAADPDELITATFTDPDGVVHISTATVTLLDPDAALALDTVDIVPEIRISCDITDDVDNDGICDTWEDNPKGLRIPIVLDQGTADTSDDISVTYILECGAGGDDPICPGSDRKDLYYEADWYSGHEPDDAAITLIVNAFDIAPVPNSADAAEFDAANSGVRLHFIKDENIGVHRDRILQNAFLAPEAGFFQIKENRFGSSDERAGINGDGTSGLDASALLTAKRQVFHYAFYAHQLNWAPTSSGWGELLSNDIIIAMGSFADNVGTVNQIASTTMHEIGHNLGLNHGGAINVGFNCKVNYLSIMNYAFQFNDLVDDRPLDFSREHMGFIDSRNLVEAEGLPEYIYPGLDGILGNTDDRVLRTVFGAATVGGVTPDPLTALTGQPIDWSRSDGIDSDTDITHNIPINNLGIPGCGFTGTQVVGGYDDWANINFDMRSSSAFANGGFHVLDNNPEATLDLINALRAELLTTIASVIIDEDGNVITPGDYDPADTPANLLSQLEGVDNSVLAGNFNDFFDETAGGTFEGAISKLETMKTTVQSSVSGQTQTDLLAAIQNAIDVYTALANTDSVTADESLGITPVANAQANAASPHVIDEGSPLTISGRDSSDPDDPTCVPGAACTRLDYIYLLTAQNEADGRFFQDGTKGIPDLLTRWGDGGTGKEYQVLLSVADDGVAESGTPYSDPVTGALLGPQISDPNDVAIIQVNNVSPTVTLVDIGVFENPVPINTLVTVTGTFTDPGFNDIHEDAANTIDSQWDWDSNQYNPLFIDVQTVIDLADIVEPTLANALSVVTDGTITTDHTYTLTGVYTPELTVCDNDAACDTLQSTKFVVVYDPTGGFTTGGGTILSPAGAFDAKKLGEEFPDTLTDAGEANFGFVSKYKKGKTTPEGNTSFKFEAGKLTFKSTAIDWLVISGARAQYKGDGVLTTVNSNGIEVSTALRFMLSVQDCDVQPVGDDPVDPNNFCSEADAPDKFRIKIFLAGDGGKVYDNEMGSAEDDPVTTEIQSGSIVVHKGDNEKGNKNK